MHSPPRKLTAEDQEAWRIRKCTQLNLGAAGHLLTSHSPPGINVEELEGFHHPS